MVEVVVQQVQPPTLVEVLLHLWHDFEISIVKTLGKSRAPAHAKLRLVMPVIHRGVEDAGLTVHGADVTAPQVTVQDRRRDHTARLEPFRHFVTD